MSPQKHTLMAGPRLPPVTIWTWRLVVLLLAVNWLLDIAFLVILIPPLFNDAPFSPTILNKVEPAWFRSFVKSRTDLWGSDFILSVSVVTALAVNVILTPAIWFSFKRRNASMYSAIAYWRIFLTSAALVTDVTAINGTFPSGSLESKVVSVMHVIAYDAFLAVIVFLMLLIAPQQSPLATNPSIALSDRSLHSYPNLAAASESTASDMTPATARNAGTRLNLPPEARSRLYASQIVSVTELDKVFAMEAGGRATVVTPVVRTVVVVPAIRTVAVAPAFTRTAGVTPVIRSTVAAPAVNTAGVGPGLAAAAAPFPTAAPPTGPAIVVESDDQWVAQNYPLPPSPPASLPRPPGTLSSCQSSPTAPSPASTSGDLDALQVALADASCFPSYLTEPLDYAVRGHVMRKGQSILYVAVNGEPRPSFAKI